MEEERRWTAGLLRRVADVGGFAFVVLAERAAEAAQEIGWEQLHSGPWHAVDTVCCDAYSLTCLHLARLRSESGDTRAALRILDLGLLIGGPLLRPHLVHHVSVLSRVATSELEFLDFVLEVLPIRSLSCKQINRRTDLSLEAFLCDYFLTDTPVIIIGYIDNWPASTKWKDMKYLKSVAGDRTVPVEVGDNYLSPGWKQELVTFSQFLERIHSNGKNLSGPTYLAQHPLFDQISELWKDIIIPDYCTASGGELKSVNAWFGPSGAVTPLHHDPHHNLFAQVVGRKYISLYPSQISDELYAFEELMLRNSSKVVYKSTATYGETFFCLTDRTRIST